MWEGFDFAFKIDYNLTQNVIFVLNINHLIQLTSKTNITEQINSKSFLSLQNYTHWKDPNPWLDMAANGANSRKLFLK